MESLPRRYLALGSHDRRSFLKTVGCAGAHCCICGAASASAPNLGVQNVFLGARRQDPSCQITNGSYFSAKSQRTRMHVAKLDQPVRPGTRQMA